VTTLAANQPATKNIAAQPVAEDDGPLSPRWIRTMVIVMVLGFAGLILITTLSYRNAPPIPARVVNAQGALVFSADDVGEGPAVFLR
jgi:nitric oxide reductase subunit B